MMTSKPIGYDFKTVIMLLQDTVSVQADEKPSVVRVYRNNELVTEFDESPTIEDWDNGYLLTFSTEEEVGDIFYCEVDVEKNEEIRIYRDRWIIGPVCDTGMFSLDMRGGFIN